MADTDLPMNDIEQPAPDAGGAGDPNPPAPPASDLGGQEPQPRDEGGKFASREQGGRGQPSAEAARRREAAERDAARAEANDFKTKYEALTKRFEDMAALAAGKDPNAEEKPDPLKELGGKVDQIAQRFQQQDQRAEAEQAWQQVRSYADQDEARFREAQPDFPDAVQHYIRSRLSEYKALGVDQGAAEQALQQEAQQLMIQCAQQQRSPAEAIYQLAAARGYAPNVTRMRNVTPAAPPRPAGGRSLGTGQGSAEGGMSAQAIAQMDDADYFAFRNSPEGQRAIRQAMGG